MKHPEVGFVKLEDTVAVTDSSWEAFGDRGRGWNVAMLSRRGSMLLDEISRRFRLVLEDVVHGAGDQSGLYLRASVSTETVGNLWKQLCER